VTQSTSSQTSVSDLHSLSTGASAGAASAGVTASTGVTGPRHGCKLSTCSHCSLGGRLSARSSVPTIFLIQLEGERQNRAPGILSPRESSDPPPRGGSDTRWFSHPGVLAPRGRVLAPGGSTRRVQCADHLRHAAVAAITLQAPIVVQLFTDESDDGLQSAASPP